MDSLRRRVDRLEDSFPDEVATLEEAALREATDDALTQLERGLVAGEGTAAHREAQRIWGVAVRRWRSKLAEDAKR